MSRVHDAMLCGLVRVEALLVWVAATIAAAVGIFDGAGTSPSAALGERILPALAVLALGAAPACRVVMGRHASSPRLLAAMLGAASVVGAALVLLAAIFDASDMAIAAAVLGAVTIVAAGRMPEPWRGGAAATGAAVSVPGLLVAIGYLQVAILAPLGWFQDPWNGSASATARDVFAGPETRSSLEVTMTSVVVLLLAAGAAVAAATTGGGRRRIVARGPALVGAAFAGMAAVVLLPLAAGASVTVASVLTATACSITIVGFAVASAPDRDRTLFAVTLGALPAIAAIGWAAVTPSLTLTALAVFLVAATTASAIGRSEPLRTVHSALRGCRRDRPRRSRGRRCERRYCTGGFRSRDRVGRDRGGGRGARQRHSSRAFPRVGRRGRILRRSALRRDVAGLARGGVHDRSARVRVRGDRTGPADSLRHRRRCRRARRDVGVARRRRRRRHRGLHASGGARGCHRRRVRLDPEARPVVPHAGPRDRARVRPHVDARRSAGRCAARGPRRRVPPSHSYSSARNDGSRRHSCSEQSCCWCSASTPWARRPRVSRAGSPSRYPARSCFGSAPPSSAAAKRPEPRWNASPSSAEPHLTELRLRCRFARPSGEGAGLLQRRDLVPRRSPSRRARCRCRRRPRPGRVARRSGCGRSEVRARVAGRRRLRRTCRVRRCAGARALRPSSGPARSTPRGPRRTRPTRRACGCGRASAKRSFRRGPLRRGPSAPRDRGRRTRAAEQREQVRVELRFVRRDRHVLAVGGLVHVVEVRAAVEQVRAAVGPSRPSRRCRRRCSSAARCRRPSRRRRPGPRPTSPARRSAARMPSTTSDAAAAEVGEQVDRRHRRVALAVPMCHEHAGERRGS